MYISEDFINFCLLEGPADVLKRQINDAKDDISKLKNTARNKGLEANLRNLQIDKSLEKLQHDYIKDPRERLNFLKKKLRNLRLKRSAIVSAIAVAGVAVMKYKDKKDKK